MGSADQNYRKKQNQIRRELAEERALRRQEDDSMNNDFPGRGVLRCFICKRPYIEHGITEVCGDVYGLVHTGRDSHGALL